MNRISVLKIGKKGPKLGQNDPFCPYNLYYKGAISVIPCSTETRRTWAVVWIFQFCKKRWIKKGQDYNIGYTPFLDQKMVLPPSP